MKSSNFWKLLCIFTTALLPFASTIQCYYCSSATDSRCPDTSQYYSQTITGEPSDCSQQAVDTTLNRIRKNTPSPSGEFGNYDCMKAEVRLNNNITVVRGCAQAYTSQFDPCVDLRMHFTNPGDLIHCSVCQSDGCNGSNEVLLDATAILIATLTFYFTVVK